MPVINRKVFKYDKTVWKHDDRSQPYYNTKLWRNLRNYYINLHPLCECCEEHGYVTPATEVHHLHPFLLGVTKEEKEKLLLDEDNLMSVCRTCHLALHKYAKSRNYNKINFLPNKDYNKAHCIMNNNEDE